MQKKNETNRQILERILDGDASPQPDYSIMPGTAKRQAMEDFADFTRYVDGVGAWRKEFEQFVPKG